MKRLLFLAFALSMPALAQQVGCGGVPGVATQTPRNGCGGVPGSGGGPVLGLPEQWLMHDGSPATTFADATVNANTITATDITWGTGTGVTSPTFNGTTSTGVAAQTTITNFDGTKPFSVSVWVNTPSGNTQILAGTTLTASNYLGWALYTSALQFDFLIANNLSTNAINVEGAGSTIPTSTPANLIVTYDGSRTAAGVKLYINGSVVAQTAVSDNLTLSAASGVPLQVGSSADSTGKIDFFTGSMSNLQVFSGVLTSGQIAAIQTAGP